MSENLVIGEEVTQLLGKYWSDLEIRETDAVLGLKRCASYSRFSSEGQRESSIERQHGLIQAYCKRGGYQEIPVDRCFIDRGKSGSTMDGRDGLKAMLDLARRGGFDNLFVEDLDRVSRDLTDLAIIAKELKRYGVEIHAATFGRVTDLHVAFYGLLGMEQRLTLLRRTSLGRWQAALRGSNPTRNPYGYRIGQTPGELHIDPTEEEIVRLIFEWFANGLVPNQIAHLLNKRGVPSPAGGLWKASTILGMAKNGSGILRNPKYAGVLVFGRTEAVPATEGKASKFRVRPKQRWLYVEKKEWRIIERRQWVAVQLRLAAMERARKAAAVSSEGKLREARSTITTDLFHGAYRCTCGSPMVSHPKDRRRGRILTCKAASYYGTCKGMRSISLAHLEVDVLRTLRDRIVCEDARKIFVEEYAAEAKRIGHAIADEIKTRKERIRKLEYQLERSVLKSVYEDAEEATSKLRREWKKEKLEHQNKLNSLMHAPSASDLTCKIQTVQALSAQIDDLILRIPMMAETEKELILVATLRKLVNKIEVNCPQDRSGYDLKVHATLAGLADDVQSDVGSAMPSVVVEVEGFALRKRGTLAKDEKKARLARQLELGEFRLSDDDWSAVGPVLDGFDYPTEGTRHLFDAALFYLRSDVGLGSLPPPYGGRSSVRSGVRSMVKRGFFEPAVVALAAAGSTAVAGLDLTPLEGLMRKGRLCWGRI